MNFIEVNGTALRYELSGNGGSTLVLIHEMGGTLESWDLVRFRLAGKRRVLRYDTRGAGLSQKVSGSLGIDTMTDDLVSLMDALGITGRVALAGVAVGGAIAMHTRVSPSATRRGGRRHQPGRQCLAGPPSRPAGAYREDGEARPHRRHRYAGQWLSGGAARRRAALRRVSRPLARRRSGQLRRHLPDADPHRSAAGVGIYPMPGPGDGRLAGSLASGRIWSSPSRARSPARATLCSRRDTTRRCRRPSSTPARSAISSMRSGCSG